ncbi:MAG TPA: glycosyltransferase, partial [Terricaulis sp.]|nr:glycosyltransferase [Terricaulis sp.]
MIPAAIAMLPPELKGRLDVVHQVREEQLAAAKKVYEKAKVKAEVAPFFTDMGQRLGAAHLVIARAGASSVTELQVAGRPAILVPFAAAADDHQT